MKDDNKPVKQSKQARMKELAKAIISREQALSADRGQWDMVWQDIANYVMPRKSQINTTKTPGVDGYTDDLFDFTAGHSNAVLAAGQLAHVTPANSRWFAFEAPEELRPVDAETQVGSDAVSRYFQKCTEIAFRELARSNFYLEIHEMYLDRGAFGTSLILLEEGKRNALQFSCQEIGTYSIAEDDEGMVDTVYKKFELTCRQAVQKFGLENCGKSIREAYASADPKRMDQKYWFIHAIQPREDTDRMHGKIDAENKPIASIYVAVQDEHVCRNSGFDEMPGFASRFLKWGGTCYGYSPSIEALPVTKQINFIEQQMDAVAEQQATPRVLIPAGMEGDVDLRAGGITLFDPNQADAIPREWGTQGRYDVGLQRVAAKQQAIKEAYHVDMFNMLAERDKQMTAREVIELVQEKLVQFSPTFARMTTELLNPLLQRVFGILYRAGKFPEPPAELLVESPDGVALAAPQVVYTSRIALAIKALENQAFLQFIEIIAPMVQIDPSVMDIIDMDVALPAVAKNQNLPVDWIRPPEKIKAMRTARAEAAQAAAQLEAAQGMAKAAKDVSAASPAIQRRVAASMT